MVNEQCSTWARQEDVDPIGTAGHFDGLLLLDLPLPWPRDIGEVPELARINAAAQEKNTRLQALVPTGSDPDRRVAYYRWDAGQGAYRGCEVFAGTDPFAIAHALLLDEEPHGVRPTEKTEVLICGHGRRDRCCGSLGVRMARTLTTDALLGDDVTVRRTSHLGGHRFAPTGIVLPEGTSWGYLDADSVRQIVARSGSVHEQLARYRGCIGLASPAIQALEASVMRQTGWALLNWSRHGHTFDDGTVGLVATPPNGVSRYWRGRVVTKRVLPIPSCGRPIDESNKTESELEVDALEELLTPLSSASPWPSFDGTSSIDR
jgi:hypothetical protein